MINTERIIIVGDRILIKPEESVNKSHGGLFLPPGVAERDKVQGGYVLKTGPGYPIASPIDDEEPWKEKSSTKFIPLQVRAGDYAIFLRKEAIEIELEKQKLLIIPQSAILVVQREDDLLNF